MVGISLFGPSAQYRSLARRHRAPCLLVLALFLPTLWLTGPFGALGSAHAQEPTLDTSAGRSAPDDEARGWNEAPGVEIADVLLFVPRAVLFVPRYALELVFYPVGELLTFLERRHVLAWIDNALHWNDEGTAGISPSLSFLSSAGFSGGFTIYHDDLLGHEERLAFSARFGGRYFQAYQLEFLADRLGGSRVWFGAIARYEADPDLLFAGIGFGPPDCGGTEIDPRASVCETRFRQERVLGVLRAGYTYGVPGSLVQLGAEGLFNQRTFGPGERDGRLLGEVYDTSRVTGFDDGATTLELLARLVIDTRERRGLVDPGARFEAFGGGAVPVDGFDYVHYGAELSVTTALFWRTRLLTLRAALEGVHGEVDDLPFTELSRLGGPNRLRGYAVDQFRDRVAALASATYRYPIGHNVSGELFIDLGTVAYDYAGLFDELDELQVGGGGGFIIGSPDDISLRLELAYGDGLHFFLTTELPRAFDERSEQL